MYSHVVLAATFATLAYGYTQPTNQTWGALNSPSLNDPVTQGQTAKVIWDPTGHDTDGVTVSLVLCHGDTTNCVDAPDAIASGLPADQKEYDWDVPCTLAPGTQLTDSGYGMLIIVDQTGEFQYSTQFSVLEDPSCADSNTTTTSAPSEPTNSTSTSTTLSTTTLASGNYTHTTQTPSAGTTIHASTTTAQITPFGSVTPSVTASASPSIATVHGAASKVGGSAIALVVAVGAAFFAL